MAAVQVAQAPNEFDGESVGKPVGESASADAPQAAPQQLSIEQTLRIMDVATTLRNSNYLWANCFRKKHAC